jgi:hypothetical protein
MTKSFVEIVQSNFKWLEKIGEQHTGRTRLPNPGHEGNTAVIELPPSTGAPLSRFTWTHELLHARFTPEVSAVAAQLVRDDKFNGACMQIAEDIRINTLGQELGVFDDKSFVPKQWIDTAAKNAQSELQKAMLYMALYSYPVEGDGNHTLGDPQGAVAFEKKFGVSFKSDTRDILQGWHEDIQEVLHAKSTSAMERLLKLVTLVEGVAQEIRELEETPQLPGQKGPKQKGKRGKGDGQRSQGGKPGDDEWADFDEDDLDNDGDEEDDDEDEDDPETPEEKAERERQEKEKAEERAKKREAIIAKMPKVKRITQGVADSLRKALDEGKAQERSEWRKKLDEMLRRRTKDEDSTPDGTGSKVVGLSRPRHKVARNTLEIADEIHFVVKASNDWGPMETRMAPLQRHFRAKVRTKGAAAPDGSNPIHWQRWFVDKGIWDRRGPRRGGTLLIDISGSMNWAQNITKELIEATPAMTIAVYSGNGHEDGKLTIIARHGRVIADTYDFRQDHGGSNVVDGYALEWLAKQQEPRVWFSDGEVTGRREAQAENLMRDAAKLCRLGNIKRAVSIEMVKNLMEGREHKGLHPTPDGWRQRLGW